VWLRAPRLRCGFGAVCVVCAVCAVAVSVSVGPAVCGRVVLGAVGSGVGPGPGAVPRSAGSL